MIIIGEKINGSIPVVAKAIAERDAEFIKARAIAQANAGATFIDCCASVPEAQEVETLHWMIDCIQSVTDLPIAVDSPSADVLREAYKFCNKPGLINSVSGEGDKIDKIFPILAENKGWQVIALLSDDTGIPKNAADRLRVFDKIMAKAKEIGIECKPSVVHSSDVFYRDASQGTWQDIIKQNGSDCVEMESFALFHNANMTGKRAACLLTISDSFVDHTELSAEDRQNSFTKMMTLALESAIVL